MSTEELLPPNFGRLDTALRSIGYTFEAAVADVIDNSIDARASHVIVRLFVSRDGQLDLVIWDNGVGMDAQTLREAMRFGADVSQELQRLGKFGLGLKLASLSQAREVRVFAYKDGTVSGRAWLETGIAKSFSCTIFDRLECETILARIVPDHRLRLSGTVVWWSGLYRVGKHDRLDEHAQKLMRRLENYLSLSFHRFLSGRARKVQITLDIFDESAGRTGIPIDLDPLDPFGYANSGSDSFPATMNVQDGYHDKISLKAHVWPPNSTDAAYRLPGGANSRQGFYFYRNNRLIQGGGWNGIRESEPHLSLARVEVDIGANVDLELSLDVKKVEIQLPPGLVAAIMGAKTPSGIDFKKYLSIADETYRKRIIAEAELPLIPSTGLPAPLVDYLHEELRLKATTKHRDLKISWKRLDDDLFFEIDRDNGEFYLNSIYRRQLLHGLAGSSTDIPVVKCLLFLLLEDALSSERLGSKLRERLERANRILVRAVKFERLSE